MSSVKNVSASGAILPTRFDLEETFDDKGTPGVAITWTLPTGDRMTIAVCADHAADLAVSLAAFLVGPNNPEVETKA